MRLLLQHTCSSFISHSALFIVVLSPVRPLYVHVHVRAQSHSHAPHRQCFADDVAANLHSPLRAAPPVLYEQGITYIVMHVHMYSCTSHLHSSVRRERYVNSLCKPRQCKHQRFQRSLLFRTTIRTQLEKSNDNTAASRKNSSWCSTGTRKST
jgi:hypothetical protein